MRVSRDVDTLVLAAENGMGLLFWNQTNFANPW